VREAEKIRLAELEENDELEEDEMTLDDLATISDEDIQALESTLKTRFEDLNSEPITPTSLQEMMRLAADIERVRVEIKEREIRAGDDAWQAQLNKEDDE
jgi:hypothetical protein